MGKRKEEAEKENAERWMLTYLDMITLLFAFFVVLYAMSNVDSKKYEELSESLATAFDGGNFGLFEMKGGKEGILEGVQKPEIVRTPKKGEAKARVLQAVKTAIKSNNMQVSETTDGITITMFADLNFDSGSAAISESGYAAIRELAPALTELPNNIRVVGHTDATPVPSGRDYSSNWELSSRRALVVLGALSLYGVAEDKLSMAAYGSTRPIQPNDTPEGRAYNRRVEILILFGEGD